MKRKTITKFAMLAFLGWSQLANSQTVEWVRQFSGINIQTPAKITVDASGNVYTIGYFEGTADFDPGVGTYNLTSIGVEDVFISKLDASGNFIWAKQFGGFNTDLGRDIAVDATGNVYTTGIFGGTVDFNPGTETSNLTSAGNRDIFISKLDASGNFLWAKKIGGASTDEVKSLKIDPLGNVYTTGEFRLTVDFDPNSGTNNLTSAGGFDVFIQKLDASGNFVWAKQFGGTFSDNGSALSIDNSGNILITGYFEGTADFDPGIETFNLTSDADTDVFITKLDASGNFTWAKKIGGLASEVSHSLAVDASGNVYTIGSFSYATCDFDPGIEIYNLTPIGPFDVFISKLDASGNFVWAKQIGGTGFDGGLSIALDVLGNVYTIGYFEGTVDFDSGTDTYNLNSSGNSDIFINKLNDSGDFVWAKHFGGENSDLGISIVVDASSNIYTAGAFQSTVNFDLGIGTNNLTSAGENDVFVHKISQCVTSYGTDVQNACDSYTWIDGNTYTSSNNLATFLLVGATTSGCDSLVTLNLTVSPLPTVELTLNGSTLTASMGFDGYIWTFNGNPITGATSNTIELGANGLYAVTATNAAGCEATDSFTHQTASLEGNEGFTNINLFPNPSQGEAILEVQILKPIQTNLKVTDIQGKTLIELPMTMETGKQQIPLDLRAFESGVYFIHFSANGTISRASFVKQ